MEPKLSLSILVMKFYLLPSDSFPASQVGLLLATLFYRPTVLETIQIQKALCHVLLLNKTAFQPKYFLFNVVTV